MGMAEHFLWMQVTVMRWRSRSKTIKTLLFNYLAHTRVKKDGLYDLFEDANGRLTSAVIQRMENGFRVENVCMFTLAICVLKTVQKCCIPKNLRIKSGNK